MNVQDESYEGASQQQEVLHGIGFGPKILDTIADRVVDKIALDGGSVGAKPKYNVKEEIKNNNSHKIKCMTQGKCVSVM